MSIFKSHAKETQDRMSNMSTIDGFRNLLCDLSQKDKARITVEEFFMQLLTQEHISVDDLEDSFKKVKDPEAVIPRIIQKMIKSDKKGRTITLAQFIDQLPADLREALRFFMTKETTDVEISEK